MSYIFKICDIIKKMMILLKSLTIFNIKAFF